MDYMQLSQRDPQWAKKRLGKSTTDKYTLGSHGCTVTALTTMLNRRFSYKLTPDEVNEKLKKVNAFADNGAGQLVLINWARVSMAFPELKWVKRVRNYNNAEVSYWVYVKRRPVMVEVQFGAMRHWVLFVGSFKCIDPWTGRMVSTNTYPTTGYALYD